MAAFDTPPVDDMRTPIGRAFWQCCHCDPSCCGLDAYEFRFESFQTWARSVSRAEFEQVRSEVNQAIGALESAPDRFYFLDEEHSRSEVLDWFRRAQEALAAVRPAD